MKTAQYCSVVSSKMCPEAKFKVIEGYGYFKVKGGKSTFS